MPTDKKDPFGEYISESQTVGPPPIPGTSSPDEVKGVKYGIGKPHRTIVRGIVAANKGPEDKRK